MKKVVLRIVKPGEEIKRATLTYVYPPSQDFWETIKLWAEGKREIGKTQKKALTVNIIIPE